MQTTTALSLCAVSMLCGNVLFSSEAPSTAAMGSVETPAQDHQLQWLTNYEQAKTASVQKDKPLFIYFTGSDWCGWCKLMDKEIFSDPDFVQSVGDKFIFLLVDFPIYTTLDPATQKQNDGLKEKFDITGFPTVIIVNKNGERIATLNYKKGGGKSYAQYLLNLLQQYEGVTSKMKQIQQQSIAELEQMYKKSSELGLEQERKKILATALQKEDSLFFLTEAYRTLTDEGKTGTPEAQNIKQKLLKMDPDNKEQTHYKVAIIDFEARAENLPDQQNADHAIQPLVAYLTQFGENDPENRWRLEMTISQVLQSKNQQEQALQYAHDALQHAPQELKVNVAQAIVNLKQSSSQIGSAKE